MKSILLLLSVVLVFTCCHSKTGSGNIITEKRVPGSFSSISVSNGIEAVVKTGGSEEVLVEADDNLIRYIETNVVDNKLRIRTRDVNFHDAHLKVIITVVHIDKVEASSGGNITISDELISDDPLYFSTSTAGNIQAKVQSPEIYATSSSGSKLLLTGKTRDFHTESSSGSTIQASDLLSENTYSTASSGSKTQVHASINLDASASSGASIEYNGPAQVHKKTSSGGDVSKE